MHNPKLLSTEILLQKVNTLHFFNKKIVFTNGCFDIIHAGHIDYLQKAKALGDYLILGLNTDSSVKKLKGEMRPINHELDRAFVLSALQCVDSIVLFSEDTPIDLIETIRPTILVKGGDYTIENIVGAPETLARGGQVEIIPFLEGRSSSAVIEKM
jgi:rfaE bifunctional protein nucleotidyltransferase chain/domain